MLSTSLFCQCRSLCSPQLSMFTAESSLLQAAWMVDSTLTISQTCAAGFYDGSPLEPGLFGPLHSNSPPSFFSDNSLLHTLYPLPTSRLSLHSPQNHYLHFCKSHSQDKYFTFNFFILLLIRERKAKREREKKNHQPVVLLIYTFID